MKPPIEQINRHRDRAHAEREELNAILDAGSVGTLSTVVDGRPWVVPMLYARVGDHIVIHGSTGAGALRQVAAGAPAAFSVVHLDGIVVAHTTFESSANYRSAVVHGELRPLEGEAKAAALDALSDTVLPGRVAEVRPMLPKELAATLALELEITYGRWTAKVRTGPPDEVPDDATAAEREAWTGVVPVRLVAGEPEPTAWCPPQAEVPASVAAFCRNHS